MNDEVFRLIKEKGLLLEREIYDIINAMDDPKAARGFLEIVQSFAGQKLITRAVIGKNIEYVKGYVNKLEVGNKEIVENIFVKLGISFEIRKESEVRDVGSEAKKESKLNYKIFYANTSPDKKIGVADFTGHFRARYQEIQRMLMQRPELQQNLVSINKISGNRQAHCIIGMVSEKRYTKNKNLIIKFEDLTGEINAVVKLDRKELFDKVDELQVDDIVGVKASGNNEMLFIYDIFFPDAFVFEKAKFDEDISVAFISDVHAGSGFHLGERFERFLEWINSDDEDARKIKYIFFVGDNVDGVGIFPGQVNLLKLKTMNEQYDLLASYLKRIPKHITIFMCPGQHDATRVAEPQPVISKRYAPALYELENLVLVTNPAMVKLLEGEKEFKFLMYHGASFNALIREIKALKLAKAHGCPAMVSRHLLKRRHLAPMHGVSPSIVYIPNTEKDPMVISEVPDVMCTGDLHRSDVGNYNGVLIIASGCWQSQTPFEEKVGNIPDPGKVPVLNLKTRQIKVFDFSEKKEEAVSEVKADEVKVEIAAEVKK